MPDVAAINAHLQMRLREQGLREVDAVTAASWLDRAGVLKDSGSRPGLPLRNLLRAGQISGQHQELNRRWSIGRVDAEARQATSPRVAAPEDSHRAASRATSRQPSAAVDLIEGAGLNVGGHARWGAIHGANKPGVYAVEWDRAVDAAPIDLAAVEEWLERVPSLRLDGARPSASQLSVRLAEFWIPGNTVVYIGLTTSTIAKRLRQYERTPLGDRRPHAGGHWLKTLRDYERRTIVTWAYTEDVSPMEHELITAFDIAGARSLPFANLMHPSGWRKAHGITGSRR